jgi:hypothetical protein
MQTPAQQTMPEERLAAPAPVSTPIEAEIHPVPVEVPAPVAIAEPAVVIREPVATTPAVHAEPAPAAVPVRSEPTPPPAPIVDIDKALQESGLVMIKTDPSKVKLAEPVAEVQYVPAPPRPRRAPPPDTGPLQIVETKK